jgi:membrane-bound inhibitor of C-type lysozyme
MMGGDNIGNRITWRCDGGKSFGVHFTTTGAEVYANERSYTLPHAQSASGARYSNGRVEYWERAGQAELSGAAGGPYVNCKRR